MPFLPVAFVVVGGANRLAEGIGEKAERLWDGGEGGFFSFEFEGDVAAVVGVVHDFGDARVIEVEGIPGAVAEVCFGLEENGLWGEEGELVVWVFEEVTGVEGDFEPG